MSVLSQTFASKTKVPLRRRLRVARRFLYRAPWMQGFNILVAKRIIDLTLCILFLPVMVILMAVIALAIYLDSGRPIVFVQDRVGKGGRKFRIYKFRSLSSSYSDTTHRERMKAYVRGVDTRTSSSDEKLYKPFGQAEMTRVGKVLRKTSLDELPQLWNVLCGEMSWIGPRPNVVWEAEAYYIWHTERLEVLPGITGLAQVRGRSGLAFDQIARYDIEYIRNLNLKLDLKIVWWTLASIICGKGAG